MCCGCNCSAIRTGLLVVMIRVYFPIADHEAVGVTAGGAGHPVGGRTTNAGRDRDQEVAPVPRSGACGRTLGNATWATSSSESSRSAAARFSLRWAVDDVPGISRMFG